MLVRREDDDEQEDDVFSPEFWKSDRACDCCGERFTYTDEIFLLEVGEAAKEHDGSVSWDALRCEDGDYQYEPYILHFDCWEEILSEIEDQISDQPPVNRHDRIIECSRCKSSIGSFEPFVASTFGEIHIGHRMPSGKAINVVERLGKPKPVCLPCMAHVIDDYFEEWEDLLDSIRDPEEEQEEDNQ